MTDQTPAKLENDPDRELISRIAMDIGKELVSYIRVMYPDVYKAMNGGCRVSLRNKTHNEIMAALKVTDADAIEARLKQRAVDRRRAHKFWKDIRKGDGDGTSET